MNSELVTDESSNDGRQSKRSIFKDVLSRTKSKFKKADTSCDSQSGANIDDFLAAGRQPVYTHQPLTSPLPTTHQPPTSYELGQPPQYTRRVSVPRLDISQASRWASAQPYSPEPLVHQEDFLNTHEVGGRSQSLSSFRKRRTKPRQLSVSFVSSPPVVIGEGGDLAEAPPVEISLAKQRSRSSSPSMTRPRSNHPHGRIPSSSQEHSLIQRKPLPPPVHQPNGLIFGPGTARSIDIGPDETTKLMVDTELDQSLESAKLAQLDQSDDQFKTRLISPSPIRPCVPPVAAASEQMEDTKMFEVADHGFRTSIAVDDNRRPKTPPSHARYYATPTAADRRHPDHYSSQTTQDSIYRYYHQ